MKGPLVIDPARTALLCIDLQKEHRRDSRYLVEGFEDILTRVKRLQDTARRAGSPVFHSAYVVDMSKPGRQFHPVQPNGASAFSDVADPNSAICPEVGPMGDEIVFVKTDASSLASGDLRTLLDAHGIEWIVVAGVWTEACVALTVKDAVETGLRVLLVKDACGSGSAAMHETAIVNLANRLYGGAVTDTDGACRLIAGETIDAWQVQGSVPMRFTYDNAAEIYASL